jgi:Domain of unknown function (DUF4173)
MQNELELQDAIELRPEAPVTPPKPPQQARISAETASVAAWSVAIGIVVGTLGSLFFYGKLIGVSFPIFIVIAIIAVFISARAFKVQLNPRNLWLVIPMLVFAAFVAIRADDSITALNLGMVLALGALGLHYLPLRTPIDEDDLGSYFSNALRATGSTVIGSLGTLPGAFQWISDHRPQRSHTAFAVGRGILLALPILFVFVLLLTSADAVFSEMTRNALQLFNFGDPWSAIAATITAVGIGALACGGIGYLLRRDVRETVTPLEDALNAKSEARPKRQPLLLSMIETGIVLVSVNVLFGLFVAVQFGYFFGGSANVSIDSLSYAEYARRGFFELVTVAVLILCLILALDWVTVRHDKRQHLLFRVLAVILVALTGVMMLSASQRMSLYEAAYGYTHLRVYTHIFIRWLAVLFGFFLLSLFRVRPHIFSLGVLACLIGYGFTLNAMNVEGYIAERNIARYVQGEQLDSFYLRGFSVDSVDAVIAMYQNETLSETAHIFAGQWLAYALDRLEWDRERMGSTLFSAHYSRDSAYAKLDAMRATLPAINGEKYWQASEELYGTEWGSYDNRAF